MFDFVDPETGAQGFQTMLAMRDGTRLNTFVFLPADGERFPVILQRTPYGIAKQDGSANHDVSQGWLPSTAEPLRGSILRGWKKITSRGYAAVYQDTRGRFGSEGEDRVYADDASDGWDTLAWISEQVWTNGRVGMSGSSAGATTTYAAASTKHPCLRAFWAQVGGSSIYDDVVCEGQSIEMERLWLWVAKNIPGLSASHREAARTRAGLSEAEMDEAAARVMARYNRLDAARMENPPFTSSEEWMRLPLSDYPDFAVWQPFLNEIITHPTPDEFRAAHNFRASIEIPGFHVTSWYDIFLTSVIAAFMEIQMRVGNQRLWIGPNDHYFIYEEQFWPRDPYFDWFGHWLKDEGSPLLNEPPVHFSPRAWTDDPQEYAADDWKYTDGWPLSEAVKKRLYLAVNGTISNDVSDDGARTYTYNPRKPVATYGGRNMAIDPGPKDQRLAESHPDYGLVYRCDPLNTAMTIAGPVSVDLHVSSNCLDTDFIAKLIEEKEDGEATLLMDGVTRAMLRNGTDRVQHLKPGEIVKLTISLGHIYHTLEVASRLRVDVTSSNFPRRARNTNSGNLILAKDGDKDICVAQNTVHHGGGLPNVVNFCVLPT
tara:strand:+ start:24600 stop:26396 length:1797 start_codon:yes stop_codon:yes gene_type:complete